jgi:hypothetical protein
MLFILGICFALVAGVVNTYLLKINLNIGVPIEYEHIIISSIVYLFFIVIYYYIISKDKDKKLQREQNNLLGALFNTNNIKPIINIDDFTVLKNLVMRINLLLEDFQEKEKYNKSIIDELKLQNKNYQYEIDNSNIIYFLINKEWKIINLNETAKKTFNINLVNDFNKKFESLKHIITPKIDKIKSIENQETEVTIFDKNYLMYLTESPIENFFFVRLVDITKYKNENNLLKESLYKIDDELFTDKKMNKFTKTTFIRILNYDKYAVYLDDNILKLFEEKFVKVLKKNGYKEIFKIDRDIYAVYDYADMTYLKSELENEIVVTYSDDKFILNPIVILGAGANYEKAKQQIFESSFNLKSIIKDNVKYSYDYINLINNYILNNDVSFAYREVKDMIMIEPHLKAGMGLSSNINLEEYLIDFNIYLNMLHKILIKYLYVLEKKKIIINLDSNSLISKTELFTLFTFIKNNQIDVVFNVNINNYFELSYETLKDMKSYFKISLKNIGNSYFNFKYFNEIEPNYIEIDKNIIEYIKKHPEAKRFLDGFKLITKNCKTELMSIGYKDEDILEIGEKKLFES